MQKIREVTEQKLREKALEEERQRHLDAIAEEETRKNNEKMQDDDEEILKNAADDLEQIDHEEDSRFKKYTHEYENRRFF